MLLRCCQFALFGSGKFHFWDVKCLQGVSFTPSEAALWQKEPKLQSENMADALAGYVFVANVPLAHCFIIKA